MSAAHATVIGMSDLVPVKVLDKNNNLVTRYVRPDKAASNTRAVPAPSVKKQDADAPTAKDIKAKHPVGLTNRSMRFIDAMPAKYRHQLMEVPPPVVSSISNALIAQYGGPTLACHLLETNEFATKVVSEYGAVGIPWYTLTSIVQEAYRDNRKLGPQKSLVPTKNQTSIMNATYFAHILASSESMMNTPLDEDVALIVDNFKAIEPAAELLLLRAKLERGYILHDAVKTADFAARYPGRMSEIVDIVRARGSYDEQLIASVLESPTAALSEGTL